MNANKDKSVISSPQSIPPGAQVARYSPGQTQSQSSTNDSIDVFTTPTPPPTETLLHGQKKPKFLTFLTFLVVVIAILVAVFWYLVLK